MKTTTAENIRKELQATILGVATLTYLPYCFFNLISPLMSITMAAIGFKIKQHHEEDQSIIVN